MITSTSSTDRAARTVSVSASNPSAARVSTPRTDHISTESASILQAALLRQPEIRPEVVARARALAATTDYPPTAIIRLIAQQILASPDLSEDES